MPPSVRWPFDSLYPFFAARVRVEIGPTLPIERTYRPYGLYTGRMGYGLRLRGVVYGVQLGGGAIGLMVGADEEDDTLGEAGARREIGADGGVLP